MEGKKTLVMVREENIMFACAQPRHMHQHRDEPIQSFGAHLHS